MRPLWLALSLWTVLIGACCAQETEFAGFADATGVYLLRNGEVYFWLSYPLWGPNWSWAGYQGQLAGEGGRDAWVLQSKLNTGAELALRLEPQQTGPRQVTLAYTLTSSQDSPLTLACVSLGPRAGFAEGGKTLVTTADGQTAERAIPYGRQPLGQQVTALTLIDSAGEQTSIRLDPAPQVFADGDARIALAADTIPANTPLSLKLTLDLPGAVTFCASPAALPVDDEQAAWFPWAPAPQLPTTSRLGMEDWLEAPAGARGRITREGDRLLYAGKPIKLWGLNVCYGSCAPDKPLADLRSRFYARYGVNAVRLHKYADGPGWAGIQAKGSFVQFDPEGLDRLDYFIARLKERGIYVTLSPTFGVVQLGPDDRAAVPYMDEFGQLGPNQERLATGHGSLYFSRELQDLQIAQMVNLLQHRNAYTGLTYAADPAVCAIEIVNEHSALFYSAMSALRSYPSLRKQASSQFCAWLTARYGDEAGLLEAWGPQALDSFRGEGFEGESLAAGTIVPAGNPWYYDPDQLSGSQQFRRRRLLDTIQFLYELQNDFYARYVQAVREAGYQGEVIASNWQAGRAYSHYLNLHSDALVGLIDRHNYFGGTQEGWVNDSTMLSTPGSGLLSSGFQQVADRPFMLSEWIHNFPNEWGAEGPAILGAYGLGLQGWDASFMFQNRDSGGFSDRIGRDTWDVTAPTIIGLFPAVARQVLRGDVAEAELVAPLRVHVPSLAEGRLGFIDRTEQTYDEKSLSTDKAPTAALAVGRTAVEFTPEPADTPTLDLAAHRQGDALVSTTGQLRWHPGDSRLGGYFTIDTPATKAVVGFAEGQGCDLGEVTITPRSPFAAIYLTAREPDKDLASSSDLLIVTIARARNTGMRWFGTRFLLDRGQAPIVMEPVAADFILRRAGTPRVTVLDHDGCPTATEVPVTGGRFTVDGARYRTAYYEVTFD